MIWATALVKVCLHGGRSDVVSIVHITFSVDVLTTHTWKAKESGPVKLLMSFSSFSEMDFRDPIYG